MRVPERIWTIGHSTHSIEDFAGMLGAHAIEVVADVRRYAGSRRNPQFSPGPLAASLHEASIETIPIPDLGGRRAARPDSSNDAWRNAAFRGYADYMQTAQYAEALARLADVARSKRTAIMCAEAVWWRCHRSLISDDLKVRGATVLHIVGRGEPKEHPYTAAATIVDGALTYASNPAAGKLF